MGREQSSGRVSNASKEVASSIGRIQEAAAGSDLIAFVRLVDGISQSSPVGDRERILAALASTDSDQMKSDFRDYALAVFASSLAKDYRVDQMLRVVDVSTQGGSFSWKQYLHARAGVNAMEVIEIRPESDLFVESAQAGASRALAASVPSRFRSAVEDETIDPSTPGFATGVQELLRQDSMRCTEWLNSFPADSPQRREGFTLVAEWLREIGRHEEAEQFLDAR